MHSWGPFLTLVVVIGLAFRDVYGAGILQSNNLFEILLWAFSPTVLFTVIYLFQSGKLLSIFVSWRLVLAINITTAVGTILYFYALRFAHPALVAVLFGSISWLAMHYITEQPLLRSNKLHSLSLVGLFGLSIYIVVLPFIDSVADVQVNRIEFLGLLCAVASALVSAFGVKFEKSMGQNGHSAIAILAIRFPLLLVIAFAIYLLTNTAASDGGIALIEIYPLLILIMVAPAWLAQFALKQTNPVTFKAIFALIPVFIILLQLAHNPYYIIGPTLVIVLSYTFFALLGNYAIGWITNASGDSR